MLEFLTNTCKATFAVAVTPAALVIDLITAPASSWSMGNRAVFERTASAVKRVGECVEAATRPTTP